MYIQAAIGQLKEQLAIEKEVWAENYRKKTDAQLLARERELQQQVKEARDADIERVMAQLLKDNQQAIDDCEREADKRIKYVVVVVVVIVVVPAAATTTTTTTTTIVVRVVKAAAQRQPASY